MVAYPGGLPARFPEGTKYVVEGRSGSGFSRYIELPDGTRYRLPAQPAKHSTGRPVRSGGRRSSARRR